MNTTASCRDRPLQPGVLQNLLLPHIHTISAHFEHPEDQNIRAEETQGAWSFSLPRPQPSPSRGMQKPRLCICRGANVVLHNSDLLMVTAAQAGMEISGIQRRTQPSAALALWRCSASLCVFPLSLAALAQC